MQIELKTIATIRGVPDLEGAVALIQEIEPHAEIIQTRSLGDEGPGVFQITYNVVCGEDVREPVELPPVVAEEESEVT